MPIPKVLHMHGKTVGTAEHNGKLARSFAARHRADIASPFRWHGSGNVRRCRFNAVVRPGEGAERNALLDAECRDGGHDRGQNQAQDDLDFREPVHARGMNDAVGRAAKKLTEEENAKTDTMKGNIITK